MRRRTLLQHSLLVGPPSLAGLAAAPLRAQPKPTVPPEIAAALPQARAAGQARMRYLGLAIYDIRLWVAPGFEASAYAQHPLALELTYQRTLRGARIAERSLDEIRRAGPLAPDTGQRWLEAMQRAFPDVAEGDRLTGLHSPGAGARFWFNGQPRPGVADAEFSRRFFGIWLAPGTSEPALREALLAGVGV